MRLVSSMANLRRSLPSLERWDRPREEVGRLEMLNPGCFLHGPEENWGLAGCYCYIFYILYYCRVSFNVTISE